MVTINPVGTRLQCPCGEWVGMTLTAGPTQREGDRLVLPISFDKAQFTEDFTAHVMADPTNADHAQFVKVVHDDDD